LVNRFEYFDRFSIKEEEEEEEEEGGGEEEGEKKEIVNIKILHQFADI